MNILPRRKTVNFIFFLLIALFYQPKQAIAVLSSCSANVSPQTITMSTAQRYVFTFDSVSTIQWIQITRPSANFTITSATAEGWNASTSSNTVTFTLGGSGGTTLNIDATSGDTEVGAANWAITASDDAGGASPTTCTGSLGTAISGAGADTTAPTISSLVVSDITDTSAKITWTTNESSNTVVDYGTSDEYGSSATGNSGATSHEVTVSGLSANTTYHYNAKSTDGSSNTTEAGNNTFVTAKSGYTGTTVTGTVTTTTVTKTITAPTPVPDRVGPKVLISTTFKKTYTDPPEITGEARDPSGVASIEYSLDGGINFLPIDDIKVYGKISVPFIFLPYQTDDGTYALVFRAIDSKGNISTTKSVQYVIDRLPPQFGALITTIGSQVIEPMLDGLPLIAQMEYIFTTSLIGGPTEMKFSLENSRGEIADIVAQRNIDTGLWSAGIHIEEAGGYILYGSAVDGAQNKTVTELSRITVVPSGVVSDERGAPVQNASVTVYVLDKATQRFVKWDGRSYGQKYPVITDKTGSYGFILPSGTYYLRVWAFGYKSALTNIFTVSRITSIVEPVQMSRSFGIIIGDWLIPLLDFSQTRIAIALDQSKNRTSAVGGIPAQGEVPFFRFPFEGKQLTSLDLRGKHTIITLLNTWSPLTPSQVSALDSLGNTQSINVLVIVPQESAASVATFMKRGRYTTRMVADPDGIVTESLGYRSSPTHIIVDRKGIIQSIIIGLATKEKIVDTIVK